MIVLDPETLEISTTENQSSEICIDGFKQRPSGGKTQMGTRHVLVFSVAVDSDLREGIRAKSVNLTRRDALASHIIAQIPCAGSPECFNGEDLSFFHLVWAVVFDKGDLFVAVDVVPEDIMAGYCANGLYRQGFSGNLDFIAFHHLLDCSTDVAHPRVNPSMLYQSIHVSCNIHPPSTQSNIP